MISSFESVPTCVTANVFPAIVALLDREELEVFCVQETVVEPPLLPLVGETLSHDPFPLASQAPWQPVGDPVTVTLWDPAVAPGLADVGLML